MNVDAIKRAVRRELGVSEDRIRYRHSRVADDGNVHLRVATGRMVTESMIEADFYQERFESDAEYTVEATPDAEIVSIEEVA